MADEFAPRRVRATYGGASAKRRRLVQHVQESPGSQSDSTGDSPIKLSRGMGNAQTSPLTRNSRRSQWPPRTPSPSRPSTPPPPSHVLSQDLASAFELASPGSSQHPTFAQRESLASPSLSSCPAQLENILDVAYDGGPEPEKRAGVASRMNRARRKDGLATQSQRASPAPTSRGGALLASGDEVSPHKRLQAHNGRSDAQSSLDVETGSHSRLAVESSTPPILVGHSQAPEFVSPRKTGARTYGSGMRTFLEEQEEAAAAVHDPLTESANGKSVSYPEADDNDPLSAKRLQQRETYAELRGRWVIEDALLDNGPTQTTDGSLRSLTNLRSAGSLKRFTDELDYLLTGLDPQNSLAIRRSAAIGVLSQICGSTGEADDGTWTPFLQRLKAARGQGKVWQALRSAGGGNGQDEVLDWVAGIALLHLAHRNAFSDDFFHLFAKDVCRCLSSMIESGGAADKKDKSRSEEASLTRLAELFTLSCPLPVTGQPSVTTVALSAVCALGSLQGGPNTEPIHLALLGNSPGWDVSAGCVSEEVLHLACAEADKAAHRIKAFRNGLPLLPTGDVRQKAPDLDHLDLVMQCIEILDIHDLTEGDDSKPLADGEERFAGAIAILLQWLSMVAAHEQGKAWSVIPAALRIGIARAQRTRGWARALSTEPNSMTTLSQVILQVGRTDGVAEDKDTTAAAGQESSPQSLLTSAQRIDTICLALALLTILLETGPDAAEQLATTAASSQGDAEPGVASIQSLLDLCVTYARPGDDDDDDEASDDVANRHFVAGCLSVAIALAVQAHPACLSTLRSNTQDQDAFIQLTACLDEFSALNDAVHERAALSDPQAVYFDGMDQMRSMAESGSVVRRMAECMRALCQTEE